MNFKKNLLVLSVVALTSANAQAGFSLIDGKTRPPADVTNSASVAPSAQSGMTGKFTVTTCKGGCAMKPNEGATPREIGEAIFKLPVKASVKALDLNVMRSMKSVLIVTDGSSAGQKKAASIKELIGKTKEVSIKPKGAASGFVMIHEGN